MNQTVNQKINLKEIQNGDVFSEESHYTFLRKEGAKYIFKHHGSNSEVALTEKYVANLLQCANVYETEVTVGKEDKYWTQRQIDAAEKKGELEVGHTVRVGDVKTEGIRTIWENIHSSQVFTVCFLKQDKKMTNKAFNALLEEQRLNALSEIEKAQRSKKGVAKKAEEMIKQIQQNPIYQVIPGEERVLYGFKKQFKSRDGKYDCLDMAIDEVRPVNINTIQWLVFNGVKYTVK